MKFFPPARYLNRISPIDDSDDDGFNDFVIGSPLAENKKGIISFYSSRLGEKLFEIVGKERSFLGLSLHKIGDINGDNVSDIIFGEYENINKKVIIKKLHAIDGITGEWLFEVKKESK